MRRLLLSAWIAVLLVPAAPARAAIDAPLGQHGRWMVDQQGRVVLLHGVNMVFKRPPYTPETTGFGDDDARWLRDNGFLTVRLGVIYAAVEPRPGIFDEAYLDSIEQTTELLGRYGIQVQLDFHQDLYNERFQGEGFPEWAVQDDGLPAEPRVGFPGNYLAMPALSRAFDHFWANDPGPDGIGLQDHMAAAWKRVAERFRGLPEVMGYDLLNEPWPGTQWPSCANTEGCPVFDAQLGAFNRRMAAAIREADPRGIVWYEPHVLYNNGPKTHVGTVPGAAGMSFHIYCLQDQGMSNPADPVQDVSCGPFEQLPLTNAEAQATAFADTLLLSEFGATDDLTQIRRVARAAERANVSWQYWHYCECDDPTTTGTGGVQSVVRDPAKPPTGENVKTDKLAVLSVPYLLATAGTPDAPLWDEASRRFEATWRTARAEGGEGSFGEGARTEVSVPPVHFPDGAYDVEVSGGRVARRTATTLVVAACAGVDRVGVVLTPGTDAADSSSCAAPRVSSGARMKVHAAPKQLVAGRRNRLRIRVTRGGRPLRGVRLRIGARRRTTPRTGRVVLFVRPKRAGTLRIAARAGVRRATATVRVVRRTASAQSSGASR